MCSFVRRITPPTFFLTGSASSSMIRLSSFRFSSLNESRAMCSLHSHNVIRLCLCITVGGDLATAAGGAVTRRTGPLRKQRMLLTAAYPLHPSKWLGRLMAPPCFPRSSA